MPSAAVALSLVLCLSAPQDAPAAATAKAAGASQASDFDAQLAAAAPTYDLVAHDSEALLLEGELAAAVRKLLDAVPEAQRSGAQAFTAAERLHALDVEQSYRLHQEAFAKSPGEPRVIEAWAAERQRAGEFADAEALWVELLALDLGAEAEARFQALRADCLLHLGRPEEACDAWRVADASRHAVAIEKAAWRAHAPLGPEARRCEIRRRAAAAKSDTAPFDELLLLDLHWDRDLWTTDVQIPYAVHDLAFAQRLDPGGAHYQTLAFLVRWVSPGRRFEFDADIPKLHPQADNSAAIRADAEALKVCGALSKPPVNGLLITPVYQVLIENGVADAEQLLKWHEDELRGRARSARGDADALRALVGLYEQVWHDDLEEFQRFGWTRYEDLGCAVGLLEGQRDALASRDPVLLQALAAHPLDVRLCRLSAEADEREGDLLVEPLSRLLMAEFARMEECQAMTTGFRQLEQALLDRK